MREDVAEFVNPEGRKRLLNRTTIAYVDHVPLQAWIRENGEATTFPDAAVVYFVGGSACTVQGYYSIKKWLEG